MDILDILKTYFKTNAEKYGIKLAFLYGSYAHLNQTEQSDIDVALVFEEDSRMAQRRKNRIGKTHSGYRGLAQRRTGLNIGKRQNEWAQFYIVPIQSYMKEVK